MDLSNLNKKFFKYIIIAVVAVVVLLLIMWLISLSNNKKLDFTEIEDKMIEAAKDYMEENDTKLPIEGNEMVLSISTLVENGNMKDLSKYTDDDVTCTGEVVVKNNSGFYSYIPFLNCGKTYKTQSLSDYITNHEEIVSQDAGLYSVGNEYIYRGEFVNNFVSFAGKLWRIIKIDGDGDIKLLQYESKDRSVWDDRYNVVKEQTVGINEYNISRLHESLTDIYDEKFEDEEKAKIVSKDLCIGERFEQDTTKDGSTECAKKLPNQKVGVIQANEYLYASIDPNCVNTYSDACQNYNYLALFDRSLWTITPLAENNYEAYYISQTYLDSAKAYNEKYIYLTLYLDKNTLYSSGTGTEEDPYIIK